MHTTDSTSAIRRAIRLSPERQVQVKVGALWAAGVAIVSCTITCTVYIVRMEGKIDRSLEGVQEIHKQMETMAPQHHIMWDRFNRTANLRLPGAGNP